MSANLDKLVAVLEAELELARRLLDLAKDARAAAISADPLLLAQIVSEQEENAARLEAIDADRAAVAGVLAAELGLENSARLRLTAIAEKLGGEDAARLRRLGGRLRAGAVDLRAANAQTRAILEAALVHVDKFFEAVTEARRGPGAYSARREGRARRGAATEAAIMDRKV
jgi:hypothetical protein